MLAGWMNSAAGLCSHWVTRIVRAISAMRAVRRLVSRLGVQPICPASPAQVSPPLPLLVERGMELGEVPAEPTVRTRVRQPHVPNVQSRTGEELLRCLPEPAQQVERVLARRLARAPSRETATPHSG